VAVCACEAFDLEGWDLAIVGHFVAFAAFHCHVLTNERELSEIMVEELGEPVVRDMAALAIRRSVLHEVISVHIVVAISASSADVPEGPGLPILHMALETGSGLVRAFKWERGLLVLLDAEHAHLESIREEVALHTVWRHTVLGEHTLVEVLVATVAGIEDDRIRVGSLMALLAINPDMLPLQWIVREVVIELVHGAQGREALLLVALGAVSPELPLVRVFVAGGALVLRYTVPVLEHRQRVTALLVAREAVRRLMLAEEPEVRCTVIEAVLACERGERLLRVAL